MTELLPLKQFGNHVYVPIEIDGKHILVQKHFYSEDALGNPVGPPQPVRLKKFRSWKDWNPIVRKPRTAEQLVAFYKAAIAANEGGDNDGI